MQAGFFKVNITPSLPCILGGYACRSGQARKIGMPLLIRAMAVAQNETLWVLISMDLLGISEEMVQNLRARLQCACGANLYLSVIASHTHGAPNGLPGELDRGLWTEERSHVPQEYVERVLCEAVRCTQGALAAMQSVWPRWKVTTCDGLYANRRNPDLPVDRRAHLLELIAQDGSCTGGLVHLACHPTVVDPLAYHVTPDMPGYLTRQLEDLHSGSVFLFANGAAGDVSTRFTRKEATEEEARRIGSEVCRALMDAQELPAMEALSFLETSASYIDRWTRSELLARYQTVELAGMRLLFCPGELYARYALEIAGHSRRALIVGYANGYLGYVPDVASQGEAGYEAEACRLTGDALLSVTRTVMKNAEEPV